MDGADRNLAALTDEGRYRLLVEAIADYAIYLLDPTGIVTTWNPGAQRFKGYRADEIVGQHFSCFYTEEDRKSGLPTRALETAQREGKFEAEGWRVRKDGSRFWAHVVVDPIRSPSGELIGFAKITRDQSCSAMAELTYMNRRAAAGQLSAFIAHEVNQPLTGIAIKASAALRLLAAETLDVDRIRAALTEIESASHRAGDIITSVRAMFKKDAPERVPTDINRSILTVLSIVPVELQKHGVELQTQLNEQLPSVQVNKLQLQQVVLNLVMNGIEAMHSVPHRVLKVQTDQTEAGMVRVLVEDTGTGIDPSNLNRIFQPLFTTKSTGMGMGLSICQSIIQSHGGRIWVSQGVNRGSIFQFELPINSA
jgi:PAS domain S-box-containing protein